MKKNILLILALSMGLFSISDVNALTIWNSTATANYTFSGEYMFTVLDDNDPNQSNILEDTLSLQQLESAMESWFADSNIPRDVTLNYFDRVEAPGSAGDNGFTVTYTTPLYGTWSSGGTVIEYYTVKGRNDYAIYWIEGGASSGYWTTEHLVPKNDHFPTVSHLTAYNVAPVPEPATLLLIGIGLAGLAGISRRKFVRK